VVNEIDRLELIGLVNPNDKDAFEKVEENLESGKFFNESLQDQLSVIIQQVNKVRFTSSTNAKSKNMKNKVDSGMLSLLQEKAKEFKYDSKLVCAPSMDLVKQFIKFVIQYKDTPKQEFLAKFGL
jgi:hypothetical protein